MEAVPLLLSLIALAIVSMDLALAMVELLKRQNLRGELIAVHNL